MRSIPALFVLLCLASAYPIFVGSAAETAVAIEDDWARATPASARNGAAYMTLVNRGTSPDRLLSVSTPAAGRAEVHTEMMMNGMMSMRPVTAIELPPGGAVALKPGGLHVMLLDLKGPLVEGSKLLLTLHFEKAGAIEVTVPIARSAPVGHQHGSGG